VLAVGLALTAAHRFAVSAFETGGLGTDDADIYLRYARNLVEGHGLVWNPGGECVEGFTSPAWMLICAACLVLGPAPEIGLHVVSVGAIAVALSIWFGLFAGAPEVDRHRRLALGIAFAAWIASSPAFLVWTTVTLMDTGLWTLAIALAVTAGAASVGPESTTGRTLGYAASLAALTFFRPEGVLFAVALLIASFVGERGGGRTWRAAARHLRMPAAALATTWIGLIAIRLAVFGYPWPNTYYAKVDADLLHNVARGFDYLAGFAVAFPAAALSVGAVLIIAAVPWRTGHGSGAAGRATGRSPAFVFTFFAVAAGSAVPLVTGGDHFHSWRMLQPVWPALFALIAIPIVRFSRGRAWVAWTPLGLALFTLAVNPVQWTNVAATSGLTIEFRVAQWGRAIGHALNRVFTDASRRPTVGVVSAGGLPRTYHGSSLDLLGLNNVAMAHATRERKGLKTHSAFDAETFYRQAPDLIVTSWAFAGQPDETMASILGPRMLKNVHREARFRRTYVRVEIHDRELEAMGLVISGYVHAAFLAKCPAEVRPVPAAPPEADRSAER